MNTQTPGQLFITGIPGVTLESETREIIKKLRPAGIILFAHNYEGPAQLAELVNDLQSIDPNFPLLVSVDHEGGRVWRFRTRFTHFPAMGTVAKLDSPKAIFELHKIMAQELKTCGINLCFAPCCDILTNPKNKVIGDRAFGSEADTVSKFVSAAIRGLHAENILACGKHFPGHGATSKDSHFDLPVVKTSLETLQAREFLPFARAIRSKVDMIMTAHIVVDSIDPEVPATLSPRVLNYLRKDLKHQQVIISDDLDMKAISDHHSPAEAAISALVCGCDMVIFRELSNAARAIEGLSTSLSSGILNKRNFEEKFERVEILKRKVCSEIKEIYIPSLEEKFANKESEGFYQDLLERVQRFQSV